MSTGYSFNIDATARFSNVTSSVSLVLIDKKSDLLLRQQPLSYLPSNANVSSSFI